MQTVTKRVPSDAISNLSFSEMQDPISVLKKFSKEFPLLRVKELFSTIIDLCVMAEDICSDKPKARQDLFKMSTHFAKVLEAVYLIVRRQEPMIPADNDAIITPAIRTVRVLEGCGVARRNKPEVAFCGKWLYTAGFHIGDEVQIAVETGRLVLAVGRQWNRREQVWRIGAQTGLIRSS